VVNLGSRLPATLFWRAGVLVMASCASILTAYLFYRAIELPARRWSASLRYRRTTPRQAATESAPIPTATTV